MQQAQLLQQPSMAPELVLGPQQPPYPPTQAQRDAAEREAQLKAQEAQLQAQASMSQS